MVILVLCNPVTITYQPHQDESRQTTVNGSLNRVELVGLLGPFDILTSISKQQ